MVRFVLAWRVWQMKRERKRSKETDRKREMSQLHWRMPEREKRRERKDEIREDRSRRSLLVPSLTLHFLYLFLLSLSLFRSLRLFLSSSTCVPSSLSVAFTFGPCVIRSEEEISLNFNCNTIAARNWSVMRHSSSGREEREEAARVGESFLGMIVCR